MSQFGFRASPNTQSAVSSAPSQSPPSTALGPGSSGPGGAGAPGTGMAVTGSAGTSAGSPPAPAQRCCDTGRPLFTDPLTGQTVCSCQYDLLGYQRLAGGVPGLPALSMYSAPYPEGMAAYFPALGADQAPFYTATAAGLDLKENLAAGAATWPYPSVYHPYDTAFAGYPFNGYGMDLNGARRKNATRETTSTLKAWLNEHKKNPYPTKGEKIMLAIITKMTLTQVSTWFANARRRLKKENKMTWEPRNRVEDEDNNNDDDDHKSTDGKDILDSKDSGTGSSEDGDRTVHPRLTADTGSEWSESRPDSGPDSPELLFERSHPAYLTGSRAASPPPPAPTASGPGKPRIWSLADMASKEVEGPAAPPPAAFLAGRLVPRLPPPAPYPRPTPHDLYRSLYAPGHSAQPPPAADVALLESYSRTFGAGLAVHAANAASAAHAAANSSKVLSLAATSSSASPGLARVSPSSTSSVSSGSEGPLPPPAAAPSKPMALNKA